MESKINTALEYYFIKIEGIQDFINSRSDLTVEEIIENGEALAVLEYKITALQVALQN